VKTLSSVEVAEADAAEASASQVVEVP